MTLEEHNARINATPRTDALVQELQRIKAPDWTIDLLAHAQKLERDLRDLMEASEPPKAHVYTDEEIAAKAACARVEREHHDPGNLTEDNIHFHRFLEDVDGQFTCRCGVVRPVEVSNVAQQTTWADGMERAAELCDEEMESARALLNEQPHLGNMARDRVAAVRDAVAVLADTIRSFKRAGPDSDVGTPVVDIPTLKARVLSMLHEGRSMYPGCGVAIDAIIARTTYLFDRAALEVKPKMDMQTYAKGIEDAAHLVETTPLERSSDPDIQDIDPEDKLFNYICDEFAKLIRALAVSPSEERMR